MFTNLTKSISSFCQIELLSLIFLAKTLKILIQQFGKRLDNFWQLGKTSLQCVNIRARLSVGFLVSRQVEG
jgi:hypothetical protein